MGTRETAYRWGSSYSLTPQAPAAEPVNIILEDGVEIRSAEWEGRLLLYHRGCAYGQALGTAIRLGWARVAEEEDEDDDE